MKVNATIPVFRIFDRDKAREFYLDFLGFKLDFEHRFGSDFPAFMQVSRDACMLRLSEHHGDACPGAAVTLMLTGIEELHAELRNKNYRFAKPGLTKTEWGSLDMQIIDPFGNRLLFSQGG